MAVPAVDAGCHRSYPPCLCLQGFSLPCFDLTEEMAGVSIGATMMMSGEGAEVSGYVLFSFTWASQNASGSVPFSVELESRDVKWTDGDDFTYVHGNGTEGGEVQIVRHFVTESEDAEVGFMLTAFEGQSNEDVWEDSLTASRAEAHEATGEAGLTEIALVASVVGFILGAIFVGIAMGLLRR